MRIVIFSDLDGTLLDYNSYSFEKARPALKKLRRLEIPVILNSSKTKPEMLKIRRAMVNTHPFICENGGAVFTPRNYFSQENVIDSEFRSKILSQDHQRITTTLRALRQESGYDFSCFADLGIEGVAAATGLALHDAKLSLSRECSEPIEWRDSSERLADFKRDILERGLKLVRGGRFYHVMGHFDKVDAFEYLCKKYEDLHSEEIVTIALGDAPNDRAMLEAADYPVVISHDEGDKLEIEHEKAYYTDEPGPVGWNEAVISILKQLNRI